MRHPIEVPAPASRGDDGRRQCGDERHQQRDADQFQRRRQSLDDPIRHRTPVGVAVAELPASQRAEPADVLDGDGLIQAERAPQPRHVLGADVRIGEIHVEGTAGHRLQEREPGHRDEEQQWNRLDDAPGRHAYELASHRVQTLRQIERCGQGVYLTTHSSTFQKMPALVGLPLKFSSDAGTASSLVTL